ncbi:MAG: class I SAM-dependent methyltransferase [Candidatus Micrarchaeota archaeon]
MLYDHFAEVYDVSLKGAPGDLNFYLKHARKAKNVLELCCGTGRILIPIAKSGVSIVGLDNSGKMLSKLNEKARKEGLKSKTILGDMRNFRINKKFDLIIIPYNSFLHVEKQDEQIQTLRNIRGHLAPGGRLILNIFYPNFYYMAKKNGKTTRVKHSDYINPKTGKRVQVSEYVKYYPIDQLIRSQRILKEEGKPIKKLRINLSYIYKKEFELLLKLAGFSKYLVYGGFKNEKLKSMAEHMVWIIER